MSKNCLVTQLKGTVDNSDLKILGAMYFSAVQNQTLTPSRRTFGITSSKAQQLKSIDGTAIFTTDNTVQSGFVSTVNIPANTSTVVYIKNVECKFIATDKYSITDLGVWGSYGGDDIYYNLDDLKYSDGFASIYGRFHAEGHLSSLAGKSMWNVEGNFADVEGTTEDINNINFVVEHSRSVFMLSNASKISGNLSAITNTTLTQLSLVSSKVEGDLPTFLNAHQNLKTITVNWSIQITGTFDLIETAITAYSGVASGVTGTLEGFVATQVKQSRTEGTVTSGSWGNVSFNGGTISSSNQPLKWKPTTSSVTGAVTDVMRGSVAITIDADGNKVADATPW